MQTVRAKAYSVQNPLFLLYSRQYHFALVKYRSSSNCDTGGNGVLHLREDSMLMASVAR